MQQIIDKGNPIVFYLCIFSVYAVNSQGCRDGWLHHGNSCYAFIDAEPDGWIEAMVINNKLIFKKDR